MLEVHDHRGVHLELVTDLLRVVERARLDDVHHLRAARRPTTSRSTGTSSSPPMRRTLDDGRSGRIGRTVSNVVGSCVSVGQRLELVLFLDESQVDQRLLPEPWHQYLSVLASGRDGRSPTARSASDDRRAFLDRHFEVVAHAHRQLVQSEPSNRSRRRLPSANIHLTSSGFCRLGRHEHETTRCDAGIVRELVEQRLEPRRVDPLLGGLARRC